MGRPRSYHPDRPATATERQRASRLKQRTPLQPAATTCVQIGDLVTLYLGDALQIAPTLQHIDALITDPPYGTNFDFTKPRRSRTPLQLFSAARWSANITGDAQPFDPRPWLAYPQVILWGAEHYRLPAAHGWIIWEKRAGSTPDDHAGCELAWSNVPGSSQVHWQKWRGMIRAGEENLVHGPKRHPAQKPVALMRKCVEATTGTVLDPYMGSGTTGVACVRLGRPFVGIELDPVHFGNACRRLQAEVAQGHLFPAAALAVQQPPSPPPNWTVIAAPGRCTG